MKGAVQSFKAAI